MGRNFAVWKLAANLAGCQHEKRKEKETEAAQHVPRFVLSLHCKLEPLSLEVHKTAIIMNIYPSSNKALVHHTDYLIILQSLVVSLPLSRWNIWTNSVSLQCLRSHGALEVCHTGKRGCEVY